MKKYLAFLTIFVCSILLFSNMKINQTALASTKIVEHSNIVVTGEAEVKTTPDAACVCFSVETINQSLAEAEKQSQETVNKIVSSLAEFEIQNSNIKTDGFYAYKKYSYEDRSQVFQGYCVQNTLSVHTTNLENVQKIISTIAENGATSFNNVNFYKQDTKQLYNNALEAALENARQKGKILTENKEIYLVKVTEKNMSHFYNYKTMATSESGQGSFHAGEIIVHAKVEVVFSTTKQSELPSLSLYENKADPSRQFSKPPLPNISINPDIREQHEPERQLSPSQEIKLEENNHNSINSQNNDSLQNQEGNNDNQEQANSQNQVEKNKDVENKPTILKVNPTPEEGKQIKNNLPTPVNGGSNEQEAGSNKKQVDNQEQEVDNQEQEVDNQEQVKQPDREKDYEIKTNAPYTPISI